MYCLNNQPTGFILDIDNALGTQDVLALRCHQLREPGTQAGTIHRNMRDQRDTGDVGVVYMIMLTITVPAMLVMNVARLTVRRVAACLHEIRLQRYDTRQFKPAAAKDFF